jgi:hypothetical protein
MTREKSSNHVLKHSSKEVTVTANRLLRYFVLASVALLVFAVAMLSCDRRHAVTGSDDPGNRKVHNILVLLTPNQVHLRSSNAVDSVTVLIAVVDSSGVGMSGMTVRLTRTPNIGYLTQPDTTDSQGRAAAIFVTEPGVYTNVTIKAMSGDKEKTSVLYISGPSRYSLNLTYFPTVPKLIDHEGDPYTITAELVDSTQRGVADQAVYFAILNEVGRITFSDPSINIARTDDQGQVEALFFNTQTDEILLPDSAILQAVTTTSTGDTLAESVVIPLRPVHNILVLEANPDEVVGDGQSSIAIRAFLLDSDGHGIIEDTVRFRNIGPDGTSDGSIGAMDETDDNGIAEVPFVPYGGVHESRPTDVIAEYRMGSIHQATAQRTVTILPIRSIAYITVSVQKQNITANGLDTSSIFITAQDSSGGLIADGTPLYLESIGLGLLETPQVLTEDGQARTKITAPSFTGEVDVVDTIIVRGLVADTIYVADTVVVHFVPGQIFQLAFLEPQGTVIMIAGSGQTDTILVEALDQFGNPVANGTQIRFRNEPLAGSSSLTPEAAPTMNGIAQSIYLVGSLTGDDNVTAFAPNPGNPADTIRTLHPIVFRCLSAEATTMDLVAGQTNIEAGGQSAQIFATLQDAYGNHLSEGYNVAFDITVAPGTPGNGEERPSFDSQFLVEHVTVPTNINGQAIVQLYSGTQSGSVSIRACTVPSDEDSIYVCNEKSLVTISSGPPQFINITQANEGELIGGSARFVQVAAIVTDTFANKVDSGTAVYFSLDPPDVAEIEGSSCTECTTDYHPETTPGLAPTRIIYGCYSTFDTVRVIAMSAGRSEQIVEYSPWFALPIYQGEITLTAMPGNLWTDLDVCNCSGGPNNNCRDTSDITATLVDGGGCPIRGGVIIFSVGGVGWIIGQQVDTTDVNGHAFTRFMIRGCDIPIQPDGQAYIEATVRAYLYQVPSVVGELGIMCRRPVG